MDTARDTDNRCATAGTVEKRKRLTDEAVVRGKLLRRPRLQRPRDVPRRLRPQPRDAEAAVVHGADERVAAAADGGAGGTPRGRPSAGGAAVAVAVRVRTLPGDRQPPFLAFCRCWLGPSGAPSDRLRARPGSGKIAPCDTLCPAVRVILDPG